MVSSPAFAGEWKLSFVEKDPNLRLPAAYDHSPANGVVSRGMVTSFPMSDDAELTAVIEWVTQNANDNSLPDAEIRLRISSTAIASSDRYSSTGQKIAGGAVSASNLWAAPEVPKRVGEVESKSTQLIIVNNSQRATRIELPARAMSVSAAALGNPLSWQSMQAAGYQAQIGLDNRSVTLSSPDIEPSYRITFDTTFLDAKYRNGIKPVIIPLPLRSTPAGILNERNGDGSIVVDSVAAWDDVAKAWYGFPWGATGQMQINASNFQNPSYRWECDGDLRGSAAEAINSGQPQINLGPWINELQLGAPNGIFLGGNGSGVGMVGSTKFTGFATDTDGAVGENTYIINWHLPYEKVKDLPNGTQRKDLYWVSTEALPDGGGVNTIEVPEKPFDYMAAIDDVLVVTEAAGLPTKKASELLAVFKALTNISNWGETAPAITITDTTVIHNGDAFRSTVRERPENIEGMSVEVRNQWIALMDGPTQSDLGMFMDDYDCFVGRVRYHHLKRVLTDAYDIHGFHSPNRILSHDVTEKYAWETWYQLSLTTPVPPALGDREVPPSYQNS